MNRKNLKFILIFVILLFLVEAGIFYYFWQIPVNYEILAKCLQEKGIKMYGASWCTYTNNQKNMFGESWKYIDYIECALPDGGGQTPEC